MKRKLRMKSPCLKSKQEWFSPSKYWKNLMVDVSAFSVVHVMVADESLDDVNRNADNTSPLLVAPEDNIKENLVSIQKGLGALLHIIQEFLGKGIELERVCRVAVLLCQSGLNQNNSIFKLLAKRCASEQKSDGGWLGVVDTMWCASFLEVYGDYPESVKSALTWLTEQRHDDGIWGQTERDIGRITVTGQMLYFLPQLASKSSLKWLEKKWRQELEIDPGLTYKGAFTLMAFKRNNYQPTDSQLIFQTIQWLAAQQNNDFGWGPWKGHSAGSDPWCTGITMDGLLLYPNKVPQKVLGTGLEWLKEKQLPNGLWPYHYIEEGSSWALYALTRGYSF
jgi:hypothetical protein